MKVLIADKLADEGIDILRPHAEVDVKANLNDEELISIIGDYEALVVRSQTQVSSVVIEKKTIFKETLDAVALGINMAF